MPKFSFSPGEDLLPARRFLGFVFVVGVWISLLVGPAAGQSGGAPAAVVSMANTLSFKPDTVRIQAGETVRWKNASVLVHTVTADPEEAAMPDKSVHLPEGASPFNSGKLQPKDTFEHTFEVPGQYHYFCIPHEGARMYGWVFVEPADGE